MSGLIICDVDNVLSDDEWRIQFIKHDEPDLDERYRDYHAASILDAARNTHLVKPRRGVRIALLTSMPERYAVEREWWLAANGIRHDIILYRPDRDHRPSPQLKLLMLARLQRLGFDLRRVLFAYDDREDVVRAYRNFGLPATRVCINERS